MTRRGFTLIEVCLAMGVVALGVLGVLGLFGLGFREASQSVEDVKSTSLADMVVSPLVMAISATNLKWSAFRNIGNYPDDTAWGAYVDMSTGRVQSNPEQKAISAFTSAMSAIRSAADGDLRVETAFPAQAKNGTTEMNCGLVIQHEQDSPVVYITFRASRDANRLLSMPVFFTAVRFQGDVTK